MIVAPLGAHQGVFSVLQRLRSVILTFLPLSAVSPLCRGRNGRLSSRGRCQSPVQRAKTHRSTMYILLVLRERASSVRFLCLGLPSSLYCAWRFLCLLAIDVILRFSGVTSFLCFVWGRFVLFRFRRCLFALCGARTCILWAFSLFGFAINQSTIQPINLTCYFLLEM